MHPSLLGSPHVQIPSPRGRDQSGSRQRREPLTHYTAGAETGPNVALSKDDGDQGREAEHDTRRHDLWPTDRGVRCDQGVHACASRRKGATARESGGEQVVTPRGEEGEYCRRRCRWAAEREDDRPEDADTDVPFDPRLSLKKEDESVSMYVYMIKMPSGTV